MQVQFYLLPDQPTAAHEPATMPAHVALVCQLCADFYRAGLRVLVFCANQQDAELLDEVLWQFDAERFVPHNLTGEGPPRGAPIEISWLPPKNSRQVLINLTAMVPAFASRFSQIIEFVPADDTGKASARQRFKHYRQHGIEPQTVPVPAKQETPGTDNGKDI